MKRIILMRHSLAEAGSNDISDEERNLTGPGMQLIQKQAQKLQQINLFPDRVVASHALRAIATAKILTEHLQFLSPIIIEPFLYHDFTTQEFLNYVHKFPNSLETVVMVGHNPNISALLYRLTSVNRVSFVPAAMAVMNLGSDNWNAAAVGKCNLEHYLLP